MNTKLQTLLTVLKWLALGYALLLTLAAGGLAFANIFGWVATAVQFGGESAPDTTSTKTWMHVGWVFGACIALIGAGWQARNNGRKKQAGDAPNKVERQLEADPESTPSSPQGRRHGRFASAAFGGFFGTVIGAALGVTFILLWFSITYSPFAPRDWVESVSVERQRAGTSGREVPVATTRHPVALIAFVVPVALGAMAGAVVGGVVRATDVD